MRRYINIFLAFVFMIAFMACDSGSGIESTTSDQGWVLNKSVSISEAGNILYQQDDDANITRFAVYVTYQKRVSDNYSVTIKTEDFIIEGCEVVKDSLDIDPLLLELNGNENSTGNVIIRGEVNGTCSNASRYEIAGKVTTKLGETVTEDAFRIDILNTPTTSVGLTTTTTDGNETGIVADETYILAFATTPIEVTQSGTKMEVRVQVIDSKGRGVPNQSVSISSLGEVKYGYFSQTNVLTDASGWAIFEYVSPLDITKVDGESKLATIYYESGSIIQSLNVEFHYKVDKTLSQVSSLSVVPQTIVITQPEETKEIKIFTLNQDNVGVSGSIVIEQPIYDNTDYGSFDKINVTTDASGVATIVYTAPDSIGMLKERNITVTEETSGLSTELRLIFDNATEDREDYNYDISVDLPDMLQVDETKEMGIVIHERGNENNVIDDAKVLEVNVTSRFPILTLDGGKSSLSYTGKATKKVLLESGRISGVGSIEISARIQGSDQAVVLTKEIEVTVISGPVTAISVFYVGSSTDEDGKFLNTYTIHAVDKYANPARAGVPLYPTLINGVKVRHIDIGSGTLEPGDHAHFEDASEDFGNIDSVTDRLIILPNASRFNSDYLGGWSIIDPVETTGFDLNESYQADRVDGLSYVVGDEKRFLARRVALADVKAVDNVYYTDEKGSAQLVIAFDPILAGHTVTLGVHSDDGNRTGVSMVTGLRWGHYYATEKKVANDGTSTVITLNLSISTETDSPIEPLANVEVTSSSIISSSSQCYVDLTSPYNDFVTDDNGQITVAIATKNSDENVKECTITWTKSNGSIYLEY